MSARAAIDAMTAGAPLRTWSLIVTIFGDMARAPGAEIPGPVLSALTGAMGVKPEAMRVALHRLRKDGWIAARRAGRVSFYFLTAEGRAQSEAATARIFARHPPVPDRWHVVLAGPLDPAARAALADRMAATGHVTLAPGAWLAPGPAPADLPAELFTLEGVRPHLPAWLRTTLAPPELAEAYAGFDTTLAAVARELPNDARTLSPLERAAVRILLVHGWRRLVLRHPELPDSFFPDDWAGARVRRRVHDLLDRIGETAIAELTASVPV